MSEPRTSRFLMLVVFAVAPLVAGCGQLFKNNSTPAAPPSQPQLNATPDSGLSSTATVTLTPNGKDLVILSGTSMRGTSTTVNHEKTNDITVSANLLSENTADASLHQHEIGSVSASDSIYSLDSAIGCHYSLGAPGKNQTRAPVTELTGSCIDTLAVSIPDHDVPRAYFNLTPLFSGPIDLSDLKVVAEASPNNSGLLTLLQTYVGRLTTTDRPLKVADVATFLPLLANDANRLTAVVILAPRVSDGANASTLPATLFESATVYARAVKILSAYR